MNLKAASLERQEHAGEPRQAPVEPPLLFWPAAETVRSGAGQRRFLLIAAPFGPFSRQLAAELGRAGARMTRVLLNAGDVIDWGFRDAKAYFGGLGGWRDWLLTTVQAQGITDIVTYGDSSGYADQALALAPELGIRTHVLEQGYFRPDWGTVEARGVNANSDLPRDPSWYRNHPAAQRPPAAEIVGRTTPAAVRHIVAYHLAVYLGAPVFPRFKARYSDAAFKQATGHIMRYGIDPLSHPRAQRAYEGLMRSDAPIFLCLLQRPGDSQLWRHSEFASVPDFIGTVLTSFAAHAPKSAQMIVRRHPLDPGLVRYRPIIARLERRLGIEGRVHLTDHGKLHEFLPRMSGAVCVNSTAGLAAIEFGVPTITLGKAMYDIPGLTHQGKLDGFWTAAERPDPELYTAFRQVVMAETQVNGAYATERGRALAVPKVAQRLLAPGRI